MRTWFISISYQWQLSFLFSWVLVNLNNILLFDIKLKMLRCWRFLTINLFPHEQFSSLPLLSSFKQLSMVTISTGNLSTQFRTSSNRFPNVDQRCTSAKFSFQPHPLRRSRSSDFITILAQVQYELFSLNFFLYYIVSNTLKLTFSFLFSLISYSHSESGQEPEYGFQSKKEKGIYF